MSWNSHIYGTPLMKKKNCIISRQNYYFIVNWQLDKLHKAPQLNTLMFKFWDIIGMFWVFFLLSCAFSSLKLFNEVLFKCFMMFCGYLLMKSFHCGLIYFPKMLQSMKINWIKDKRDESFVLRYMTFVELLLPRMIKTRTNLTPYW